MCKHLGKRTGALFMTVSPRPNTVSYVIYKYVESRLSGNILETNLQLQAAKTDLKIIVMNNIIITGSSGNTWQGFQA